MVEQLDVFLQQGIFIFLDRNAIEKIFDVTFSMIFLLQKQKTLWNYYLKH